MEGALEVFFVNSNFSDLEVDTVFDVVESLGYKPEDKGYISLPRDSYSFERSQYNAGMILKYVSYLRKGKALAVVKEDIYFQNLNFVFGIASPTAKIALVSFVRLNPEFYGYPFDKDKYVIRIKKEIIHELGHLEGLVHCNTSGCVMNFSNSISDVDLKSDRFCATCLKQLGKSYY